MVDEYVIYHQALPPDQIRSDSSMVDEYAHNPCWMDKERYVQIPLWSMNTSLLPCHPHRFVSSDSSMVDEYPHPSPSGIFPQSFRFLYGRWIRICSSLKLSCQFVQIPLWSMNTRKNIRVIGPGFKFRFLYGRWIRIASRGRPTLSQRSDSSMVDEYPGRAPWPGCRQKFRFLYGRWIQLPAR